MDEQKFPAAKEPHERSTKHFTLEGIVYAISADDRSEPVFLTQDAAKVYVSNIGTATTDICQWALEQLYEPVPQQITSDEELERAMSFLKEPRPRNESAKRYFNSPIDNYVVSFDNKNTIPPPIVPRAEIEKIYTIRYTKMGNSVGADLRPIKRVDTPVETTMNLVPYNNKIPETHIQVGTIFGIKTEAHWWGYYATIADAERKVTELEGYGGKERVYEIPVLALRNAKQTQ